MELLILDTNLQSVDVLDTFKSLIWTDRFLECGDFEIYTAANAAILSTVLQDYYLWLDGSDHVMIVEDRKITSDEEDGAYLTITGRSLESILERRIIWAQTILDGNFQLGIQQLLNENIISPTITNRQITNFIFEESFDAAIAAMTVKAQFEVGDNLYESIQAMCAAKNVGFKVTLNAYNQFVFKLYLGQDRSYDQTTNSYVVFSPEFDNLSNSEYSETSTTLKTVSLVAGEGEGSDRTITSVTTSDGGGNGLSRREMFTDASGVSTTTDSGTLSTEDYVAQLAQKGAEDLSLNTFTTTFDGKADVDTMYKYGTDFFMGDIVQIVNEYGIESKTRVVEVIYSQSTDSTDVYPTFAKV